ncbi:hypothetical protein AB0I28_05330 [Phytomonospora sp. NPDC050363]|uniref:hypothetical protein n=1 Tax=Phytomonospora sp. NPDC050363 TaxID=3155642 RepID=UPI0033E05C81
MDLLAADFESNALFNGLAYSFTISGVLLMIVAAIGGKNTIGKRVFFGILGLVLVVVGLLCLGGVWNEIWIGGGKSTLCILFGPWAALIWGVVGLFKASESGGDKRDVPAPTAQQWNQQQGLQQWGAPGAPGTGAPQQWGQAPQGQPGQTGQPQQGWGQQAAQPQQWGQQPGQYGQPQAPQQWGQQPPAQPGWGQQPQQGQQPGQPQWGQQPGQPGQPGQAGQPPQGWQQYPPQT